MQDNNHTYESARNPNQIEDYDYMWNHYMGQKRPSVCFQSVPHFSSQSPSDQKTSRHDIIGINQADLY